MKTTNLASFQNPEFDRGGSRLKEMLWMLVSALFFRHSLAFGSSWKVMWLRVFGAKVGQGVLIKPQVHIKFPWKLTVGNHTWIGEKVWIDNLMPVSLGNQVCLSQGALLLCGNHNYKKVSFDLMAAPITIEDGAWIGARALVGPGVVVKSHAVLAVQSVALQDLDPYGIYQGNPAHKIRDRAIE